MTKKQEAIWSDVKQLLPHDVELCLELNDPSQVGFKARYSEEDSWSESLHVKVEDCDKLHTYYLAGVRCFAERLTFMAKQMQKLKEAS